MFDFLKFIILIPVIGGSVFSLLCVLATYRLLKFKPVYPTDFLPPISIMKPIYGLDRELEENLHSFCQQDYPEYQVVLCLQRHDDPALNIARNIAATYPEKATLVIYETEPVVNGKIQNISNGLAYARYDHMVISDADVRVAPDYLRTIIAPLHQTEIGYSCTLYRTAQARNIPEKLELLSMNADFVPSLLFTAWTNSAVFCLGATVAFRRQDVEAVGGIPALADYLVEDQEMGRRLVEAGKKMALIPTSVDIIPDYTDFGSWWRHQVYWDQNTKAANRIGFTLTVLTRAIPFALLYALITGFSIMGCYILFSAVTIRIAAAAIIAAKLEDREVIRALWLMPLRDVLGLVSWGAALIKRTFIWRGHRFSLDNRGRIARIDEPETQ